MPSSSPRRRLHLKLDSKPNRYSTRGTVASSVMAYKADSIESLTSEPYLAPPERPGLPRFHVQINLHRPLPNSFELLSPTVVIDGEEIKFPVMRFEQRQWMGISPFNC